jgi:metal-responsive CopG/Arc/MetJ family transcriptional regulator
VKIETSITLPEELLAEIDKAGPDRSDFLERAAKVYLKLAPREDDAAREAEIINANLEYLKEEVEDVLGYGAYLD